MTTGEALAIVHELARSAVYGIPIHFNSQGDMLAKKAKVEEWKLALDTVEDFIVNNFGEDDEDGTIRHRSIRG